MIKQYIYTCILVFVVPVGIYQRFQKRISTYLFTLFIFFKASIFIAYGADVPFSMVSLLFSEHRNVNMHFYTELQMEMGQSPDDCTKTYFPTGGWQTGKHLNDSADCLLNQILLQLLRRMQIAGTNRALVSEKDFIVW